MQIKFATPSKNSARKEEKKKEKNRNFCYNLLRKAKKEYFAELKKLRKRRSWQTVKPLFSNKVK